MDQELEGIVNDDRVITPVRDLGKDAPRLVLDLVPDHTQEVVGEPVGLVPGELEHMDFLTQPAMFLPVLLESGKGICPTLLLLLQVEPIRLEFRDLLCRYECLPLNRLEIVFIPCKTFTGERDLLQGCLHVCQGLLYFFGRFDKTGCPVFEEGYAVHSGLQLHLSPVMTFGDLEFALQIDMIARIEPDSSTARIIFTISSFNPSSFASVSLILRARAGLRFTLSESATCSFQKPSREAISLSSRCRSSGSYARDHLLLQPVLLGKVPPGSAPGSPPTRL